MRSNRSLAVWVLAVCALIAACDGGADTGNADNAHDGRGDGGRDTVTLGELVDAATVRDAEGGDFLPADAGGMPAMMSDGETPITMSDASVEPQPEPDADVVDTEPMIVPDDPGERGPWPVGVRTSRLEVGGGMAPAEIWYPAVRGSEVGQSQVVYDFIKWLPPEAQDDVPSSDKPVPVRCNCYRDLPIDTAHGPFPVVLFVHNFGAFRVSSSGLMEQWASRGYVVIALDHPRLHIQDVLAYASLGVCTGSGLTDDVNRTRDLSTMLTMVRAPSGELAFLAGAVDANNIAVAGHSDGAGYAANASGQPGVRLLMLWNNPIDVTKKGDLEVIAYFAVSGDRTSATGYSAIKSAYLSAPRPALFVGADRAGHLSMTELCNAKSAQGRDGMAIATRYGLCSIDYTILSAGWDCESTYLDQLSANHVFGFATSATLEQVLKGKDESAAWARFNDLWGEAATRSAE